MQRGWSDEELKASVEAYRKLLEGQSANVKIVKAHVYRELAVRFDRDAGAFERRMQNISSIFQEHGLSWVNRPWFSRHSPSSGNSVSHTLLETAA